MSSLILSDFALKLAVSIFFTFSVIEVKGQLRFGDGSELKLRHLELAFLDVLPVHVLEERMLLKLVHCES